MPTERAADFHDLQLIVGWLVEEAGGRLVLPEQSIVAKRLEPFMALEFSPRPDGSVVITNVRRAKYQSS